MKKTRDSAENMMVRSIRAIVIGCVAGAVICAILLAVCAFALVSSGRMPHGMIPPITLAIAGVSSLLAGIVSAKIARGRGLVCGAFAGFLLFLLVFLSGLAVANEPMTLSMLTKGLVMLIAGAMGGVLAVNKRARVK